MSDEAKPRRIILNPRAGKDDLILQVRAAMSALKGPRPEDGWSLIQFENGDMYAVRWNAGSVSVRFNSNAPWSGS